MVDSKGEADFLQPPDDIATLYTWANLYGAKYRDFSASRQQRRIRNREEAQAGVDSSPAETPSSTPAPMNQYQQGVSSGSAGSAAVRSEAVSEGPGSSSLPASDTSLIPDSAESNLSNTSAVTFKEVASRKSASSSWSGVENPAQAKRGTKDKVTATRSKRETSKSLGESSGSRWHALKNILGHAGGMPDLFRKHDHDELPPIVAVFSLSGGVGKTSLLAALGRSLSVSGEKVLLVDTAPYGLLPFYFGAREQRPGIVRTFAPAESYADASVRVISLAADDLSEDISVKELAGKLRDYAPDANRILIDLATASKSVTYSVLRLSPTIVIPVVPDMSSVMTLGAIEFFFRRYQSSSGEVVKRYYLLNQFDATLPLHVDIRETLSQQLGDRLLTSPLRHDSAVSEALAEGITVVDYDPYSAAAEDIANLSNWLQEVSPAAVLSGCGAHWSEQ